MSTSARDLPFIDVHAVDIAADPETVWEAILHAFGKSFNSAAATRGARLLGCADTEAGGPPLPTPGAAVPGFHVESADRPRELVMAGRHRFSRYALTFHLEPRDGHTTLRAETRATFPGPHGAVYKTLVIHSRGHVVATRRILHVVRSQAGASVGRRARGYG